jgi:hypothetical protein
MPLHLGGGSFTPFIKYNAKTGRWSARFGDSRQETEFEKPRLIFDFANIKTGWIKFNQTGAPRFTWDADISNPGPKPEWGDDKTHRGFKVNVAGGDDIPGGRLGLRELMSNSGAMNNAMAAMYEQYEQGVAAHPNGVPFFVNTGTIKKNTNFGPVYEPVFILKAWVDRAKVPELNAAETSADDGYVDEPYSEPEPEMGTAKGPAAEAYDSDPIPF